MRIQLSAVTLASFFIMGNSPSPCPELALANEIETAIRSDNNSSIRLDSGIFLNGKLYNVIRSENGEVIFLSFKGPMFFSGPQGPIEGQGVERHAQGFSSPLGPWRAAKGTAPKDLTAKDLSDMGLVHGHEAKIEFTSGFVVEGVFDYSYHENGALLFLSFSKAKVTNTNDGKVYYRPNWGPFEMAVGASIQTVIPGSN